MVKISPRPLRSVRNAMSPFVLRACAEDTGILVALTAASNATSGGFFRITGASVGWTDRETYHPSTRRVAGGRHRRLDARVLRAGPQHERAHRVPHRSERARRDLHHGRLGRLAH